MAIDILDFDNVEVRAPATGRRKLGFVADDDPRLSDAREPLPHTHPIADVDLLQDQLDQINVDILNLQAGIGPWNSGNVRMLDGYLQIRNETTGLYHTITADDDGAGNTVMVLEQVGEV